MSSDNAGPELVPVFFRCGCKCKCFAIVDSTHSAPVICEACARARDEGRTAHGHPPFKVMPRRCG